MEKNINCTHIHFRSKFLKHIQNDFEHDILLSAFEKFILLDKKSAIDIIWRMSYASCSEALWKIGLDPQSFSEEYYTSLRNELRNQYEEFHHLPGQNSRDFWSETVPVFDAAVEAFDELMAQSNIIVATVVYQKCHTYLLRKCSEQIERALFLLNAYKEKNNYGGICELGFNNLEADYLKSIHSKIFNLLHAMFFSAKYQKAALTHKPFENLGQQIKAAGNDLPFTFGDETDEAAEEPIDEIQEEVIPQESPVEEPSDCISTFSTITAENVLAHKAMFSAFAINRDMSGLIQLNQLGFDLNQVVAKEEAITNLLKAAEALNN